MMNVRPRSQTDELGELEVSKGQMVFHFLSSRRHDLALNWFTSRWARLNW